jgi:hypothetical protein
LTPQVYAGLQRLLLQSAQLLLLLQIRKLGLHLYAHQTVASAEHLGTNLTTHHLTQHQQPCAPFNDSKSKAAITL